MPGSGLVPVDVPDEPRMVNASEPIVPLLLRMQKQWAVHPWLLHFRIAADEPNYTGDAGNEQHQTRRLRSGAGSRAVAKDRERF